MLAVHTRTPSHSSRQAKQRLGRPSYLHYLLFGAGGILALALAGTAHADTVNWVGPPNGNWFTDSNWNWDGHAPTASDAAHITIAGPLISSGQSAQANQLFIGTGLNTNGTLSIQGSLQTQQITLGNSEGAQGFLTVAESTGSWTNAGDLTVGNGGQGIVNILNQAIATSGNTTLGASAGGSGTLLLQQGASFTSGSLNVGYAGNGGLPATLGGQGQVQVQSGASLISTGATLADGIGASGSVTVDGPSSTWTNTGLLNIGGGGQGQLRLANGGKLINTGTITVGHGAGSAGSSLILNGAGSALQNNGALFVGNFGSASLSLINKASLTTDGAIIGRHTVATATISDLQSQWTTGELLVGGDSSDPSSPFGSGTLTIQNKASVTSTSARLGDVAGATGQVNINGVGSTWTVNSGNLQIGASGTGTLRLQNGGLLNTQHAILGQNAGANGTAYLSEQGSTWTAAGNIYVGNAGTGTLSITQGAKASSLAGYVGTQQGSNSSVTISGADASWSMTESIIVGYENGAIGNVSLINGGQLKAVQGSLGDLAGSRGTMFITGAGSNWHAFEDGQTAYAGYLNIGRHGLGELTLTTGGSVTGTRLYVGNEAGSSGTVRLFNDNSSIVLSERLGIGNAGTGVLTLSDGALLRASDIRIAAAQGSTGTLNIGAASGQSAQAAGRIETSAIVFGSGNGSLLLNHSNSDYTLAAPINGAGKVSVESGTTTLTGVNGYTGGTVIQGGVLSGQTNSFGSGNIQNNAALIVSGSGALANNISGSGSLEKTGDGTVTLTGSNTHTGGTVISQGTLVASTQSLPGHVANYGTLILDQNLDGIFAGDISGSGNLVKDGTGIVTLTGNLSYSGSTTVRAGQLIGNTSSLSGSVINEGKLEFNQSFNGTYSSTISGSGSLTKAGSGTLTLTGANTYTGGTWISAGTLAGLTSSFGSGAIQNDAALILQGGGVFGNLISGTGTLEKTGAGQLILTGVHSYTGPTLVSAGTLTLNGTLASAVTVASNATLGGNGTLGTLLVQSGGILAPGNSIGTLNVNGDATLASGSTYEVEVDNAGNSDRLNATGAIHIGSGVTLNVRPENGTNSGANYALETRYTILNAAQGVTGQFDAINENFAFLTASVDKSADLNSLYLTLRRTYSAPGAFAAATRTPNASASAYAVEALGPANSLYQSVLYLQGDEPQQAFSQLAGELHAAVSITLTERSRLSRLAIMNRLNRSLAAQQETEALGTLNNTAALNPHGAVTLWADAFGAWSDYKTDGNGAAIRAEGGGLLLGADKRFGERWLMGVAAGYGRDHIKQTSLDASANVDSYYLSAYGGAAFGDASVKVGAIHAFQRVKGKRGVAFSNFSDHLKANYDASTTQLFTEGAWRFDLTSFQLEPYVNLAYVQTRTKGFSESGGAAALSADSQHHEQLFSTLGLRSGYAFTLGNTQGRLTAGIGWRHIFGTLKPETALSFAGGETFNVASTGPARNALVLDLNAGFALSGNTDVSVGYNAVLGKGIRDNAANARLKVRF